MSKTKRTGAQLMMPCPFPFCEGTAKLKPCKGKRSTYYWCCDCQACGFFPEAHFRELDKLKQISCAN